MTEAVKEFEESYNFLCVSSAFASLPAWLDDWSGASLTGASLRSSVGACSVALPGSLWPVSHLFQVASVGFSGACQKCRELAQVDQHVFTHALLCRIGNGFLWLVAILLEKNYEIGHRKKQNTTVCSQYGDHVLLLFLLT